jgi:SAM-dependent methyltransferase
MKWYLCVFVACALQHTLLECRLSARLDGKSIINRYYAAVTGFGIGADDEKNILHHGGAPTYGEMTLEGVDKLIAYLKPTKQDVFVDAGSGVGKLVVQFFFDTEVKKSIGVELSKERFDKALQIKEALKKDKALPRGRSLEFYHADILDAIPPDTTLFFMCSTCFSHDLMKKITERLSKLKPSLRVVTLKQLPKNEDFMLQDTLELPMTWSPSTSVYIYKKK